LVKVERSSTPDRSFPIGIIGSQGCTDGCGGHCITSHIKLG